MDQALEQDDGDVQPTDNLHDKYILNTVMWWWRGACDIATSCAEADDEDQKAIQAVLNRTTAWRASSAASARGRVAPTIRRTAVRSLR